MSVTNSFSPNTKIKSSEVNQNFTDLTSSTAKLDWTLTDYVPDWTGSGGTPPAIGDGTLSGYYMQMGKIVFAFFSFTAGSTTTFGNGTYRMSLPVTAAASSGMAGAVFGNDSNTTLYNAVAVAQSTTTVEFFGNASASPWSNTVPFTWANGDSFYGWVIYKAA